MRRYEDFSLHHDQQAITDCSQTQFVNEKESDPKSYQDAVTFPNRRITNLLNGIRAALGESEGRVPTYDELARFTGRPANTIGDWYAGSPMPQVAALLCLLERLQPDLRRRLMDEACRICPSLRHPRIGHDFHAIDALSAIIEKSDGLTLIQGALEHQRTFVFTALAHDFNHLHPHRDEVAGMDIHPASEFVPAPGLIYLQRSIPSASNPSIVRRCWQQVRDSGSGCIMLNGIVGVAPDLIPELIQLSLKRHIIVADQLGQDTTHVNGNPPEKMHLVMVSPSRHHPAWIQVKVQEY